MATDIARSNQKNYPCEHKGINHEKNKWQWRTQSLIMVTEIGKTKLRQILAHIQRNKDEQVLHTIWIDRTFVQILTAAYNSQKKLQPEKKPKQTTYIQIESFKNIGVSHRIQTCCFHNYLYITTTLQKVLILQTNTKVT